MKMERYAKKVGSGLCDDYNIGSAERDDVVLEAWETVVDAVSRVTDPEFVTQVVKRALRNWKNDVKRRLKRKRATRTLSLDKLREDDNFDVEDPRQRLHYDPVEELGLPHAQFLHQILSVTTSSRSRDWTSLFTPEEVNYWYRTQRPEVIQHLEAIYGPNFNPCGSPRSQSPEGSTGRTHTAKVDR